MFTEAGYRVPEGALSQKDVFVGFGADGYALTRELLEKLPYDFTQLRDKRVLIKPNAGRRVTAGLGINTNPIVVAAVVDFFLEQGVRNLRVGDSPILGVTATETLEQCGIAQVVRERGVELVDLDAREPRTVAIPNPRVVKSLKVCREVLESDFVVSVPVMKTHMHTQVSLGLKNMKGCLYKREKVRLHQLNAPKDGSTRGKPLDMAIADLAKILLPDMTVIDGTIGLEGLGPSAGSPKPFGAMVASFNCLAADTVAARLMGIDPDSIHHLQLAPAELGAAPEERLHGFGQFQVFPEDYLKWASPFQLPPSQISFEFDNVEVDDSDSCSACLSTVLMFLRRYHAGLADYFNEDQPLRMAIGKGIGEQQKGTILVGNCTIHRKTGCVFVKGCPPVASEIMKAVEQQRKKPGE